MNFRDTTEQVTVDLRCGTLFGPFSCRSSTDITRLLTANICPSTAQTLVTSLLHSSIPVIPQPQLLFPIRLFKAQFRFLTTIFYANTVISQFFFAALYLPSKRNIKLNHKSVVNRSFTLSWKYITVSITNYQINLLNNSKATINVEPYPTQCGEDGGLMTSCVYNKSPIPG